jgi:hypothetical protein
VLVVDERNIGLEGRMVSDSRQTYMSVGLDENQAESLGPSAPRAVTNHKFSTVCCAILDTFGCKTCENPK